MSLTPVRYRKTLQGQDSLAFNDDYIGTGRAIRHIELDGTYVLYAVESDAGIYVRLGTKETVNCITWDTAGTRLLSGTYTLEDFTQLSSTKALLVCRESGGNISTAVVSFTAPSTIAIASAVNSTCDAVTLSIKGAKIDTDKVIIVYKDTSDSYPKAVVCSIASTTPSYGTPTTAKSATVTNADSLSVIATSTSAFFMTYDNGTNTYGHILSVSGTNITTNTENSIGAVLLRYMQCDLIDSTRVVFLYLEATNATVKIAVISGTTISSYTTAYVAFGGAQYTRGLVVLSTSLIAVGGTVTSNGNTFYYMGNVSASNAVTFDSGALGAQSLSNTAYTYMRKIDSTTVSVCWDYTTGSRRAFSYAVFQRDTVTSSRFFQMVQKVLTVSSGKEVSLTMIKAEYPTSDKKVSIYINGTKYDSVYFSIDCQGVGSDASTDIGRGLVRLNNCPIVLSEGDSLYVGIDDASSTPYTLDYNGNFVSFFGFEETL